MSITNLKKYFPVAKTKWFQKEQLYVRANEDITIDIFSGETFGLVGESGCGKSTLGRTILQLYDQTAGSTLYYGRTLEDFAPEYVAKTLMRAPKMIERYKKEQAKAHSAAAEVEKRASRLRSISIRPRTCWRPKRRPLSRTLLRYWAALPRLTTRGKARRHC